MGKIMAVGSTFRQTEWLIKLVGFEYEVFSVEDDQVAITHLENKDHDVMLILLYVDALGDRTFNFLRLISTNTDLASIPVIVATEMADEVPISEYLRNGAYDYVYLKMEDSTILRRIVNIIKDRVQYDPKINSMNAYMFNYCIGAAMFVEVQDDIIRGLKINDAFFELLGFEREEFEQFKANLMDTVISGEVDIIQNAIQNAIEKGEYSCLMSNIESNRIFKVNYHRIGQKQDSTVLLATVDDITESIHSKEISDAMLQIPGIIFYDYDLANDKIHVYVSKKDGIHEFYSSGREIEEDGGPWISPNSYNLFVKNFKAARDTISSGSFEIKARFSSKIFTWHRLYFRSVVNQNGIIYRIVGRIDDLERNLWNGLSEKPIGICDIETNLLTYHTVARFTDQVMQNKKEGILLLLDVEGLNKIKEVMPAHKYQHFIKKLIHLLKDLFIPTDIMGKFGEEGIIIFMPETLSLNVAKNKAEKILEVIDDYLKDWNHKANIGIAIVNNHYFTSSELISDANIALLEAKKSGPKQYRIFEN